MWLGAACWQSGAFKCGPRDRWTGWAREWQFRHLHPVVNNMRFVLFGAPGVFPHLAPHALSRMARMARRLAGRSKGHSRSDGGYVREPGAGPKDLHVRPLRRDVRRRHPDARRATPTHRNRPRACARAGGTGPPVARRPRSMRKLWPRLEPV